MIDIILLTADDVDLLDSYYAEMQRKFNPAVKSCLDGPDYPELKWLQACIAEEPQAHDIAVAIDGDEFVGIIVLWRHDARIIWQIFNAEYVMRGASERRDAIFAFTQWTLARHGISYGMVQNPVVRAVMDAVHPRITVSDDGMVFFDIEP